jgi:hypothetical protein
MSTLEVSQIIFNFVISLSVVVVTVLISVIAYDIIKCSKAIKKFFDGVTKESSELYEKIDRFLENIFKLSFISKFFKKKKQDNKGRTKSH